MYIAFVNATPFALALVVPTIGARLRKTVLSWVLACLIAALFVFLLSYLPAISTKGVIEAQLPWVPQLGLSLSLYLDALSLLFALLVTGIGAVVILYAGHYFEDAHELNRFYRLLLIFMGGMLGLVLAGNLFVLFICWEVTSISSFFLISFRSADPAARAGALQALIVTGGGGLALLVGLALLGTASGSMELGHALNTGELLRNHPWYSAIALLIFAGCFSKSAQWPLHFWLPDAMHAPTPASAYLHSATMVKAGIYLLARLYPILGDTVLWQTLLTVVGLATLLVGALLALRQRDLKACLAYATISQLGALVALLGQPDAAGVKAALIGILAHALYKGALFLIVGMVDHATGTRNLDALGGLARRMPGVALVAGVAGLSMAGLPPLLGFVAKETLLETMLHGPWPVLTLGVVVLSAAFTVTLALRLVWDVFFAEHAAQHRDADSSTAHPHVVPQSMLVGPGLLAGGSLLAGLNLNGFVVPILAPFMGADGGHASLSLFTGINTPFALSLVAIVSGVMVFQTRRSWLNWRLPRWPRGSEIYQFILAKVETAADFILRSQGGKLRLYLIAILCSVITLMATAGLTHVSGQRIAVQLNSSTDLLKAVLLFLALGATLASILFRRHLLAALSLGVAGYSVGGIFLLEPAPDVALVQFLVETLGTVLVIIMLGKISAPERQQAIAGLWSGSKRGLVRDAAIAGLIGVGVALFSLAAVINRPTRNTVTAWHLANALPKVGATDVVAAIVTDFRGMDTVIEITVFGMAALGVLTLLSTPEPGTTWQFAAARVLRQLRARGLIPRSTVFAADSEAADPQIAQEAAKLEAERTRLAASRLNTPFTRAVAILALPFSLLIALSHILYSGVAPGDGFTAGVVSGIAVSLWYVVFGYEEAKRRLHWLHPARLIGLGIGLAVLNAALPLIFGQPFLVTTLVRQFNLPADIHLSSTMVFETGIFLTVLGGSSLIMETIAHPQEVETL